MARFKIGQKVVAIVDNRSGAFKRGDVFTVDGFSCCPYCGLPTLFLKEKTDIVIVARSCGRQSHNVREEFAERAFAPLANISDAIEYKMKVSIPELTEIKETQLQ